MDVKQKDQFVPYLTKINNLLRIKVLFFCLEIFWKLEYIKH